MQKHFYKNILFNSVQVMLNQLLGIYVFVLLSRMLGKNIFGELNWSLALLTVIFTLLALQFDQVVVRNIAAGKNASTAVATLILHNFIATGLFGLMLILVNLFFPLFFASHALLWLLFISQAVTFLSVPMRQLLAGKNEFGKLAVLSTVSNFIRATGITVLVLADHPDVLSILYLFCFSAIAELFTGWFIAGTYLKPSIALSKKNLSENFIAAWTNYRQLITASLPQAGQVFLTAGITRLDWVLLGIFCGTVQTAEYSFVYRAWELSPVPLLIVAPILLNHFSGLSKNGISGAEWFHSRAGNLLVRMEMLVATVLPMCMILCWPVFIDAITMNRYGSVNELLFFILSLAIPFQYLNNLLWSMEFAGNRLKFILQVTAISGITVILGDLITVPFFAGTGAACSVVAGMLVQYFLFSRKLPVSLQRSWMKQLTGFLAIALLCGFGAGFFLKDPTLRVFTSVFFYFILVAVFKLIKRSDLEILMRNRTDKKENALPFIAQNIPGT